jgi:hypothetical protein
MAKKKVVSERVEYGGHTYIRYPEAPMSTTRDYYRRIEMLHIRIWEDAYGLIPPRHEIHHKDGNPLNNALDNLECLTIKEHKERHRENGRIRGSSPKSLTHLASIRPKAAAWHQSEEGREWHRQHGVEAFQTRQPRPGVCDQCGKEFGSMAHRDTDRFCSTVCKSAWRRAAGLDNEERACERCGILFVVNKYDKIRFCSRSCSASRPRRKGWTRIGGRWARDYDACIVCGETTSKHASRGRCHRCYQFARKASPSSG